MSFRFRSVACAARRAGSMLERKFATRAPARPFAFSSHPTAPSEYVPPRVFDDVASAASSSAAFFNASADRPRPTLRTTLASAAHAPLVFRQHTTSIAPGLGRHVVATIARRLRSAQPGCAGFEHGSANANMNGGWES